MNISCVMRRRSKTKNEKLKNRNADKCLNVGVNELALSGPFEAFVKGCSPFTVVADIGIIP